MPTPFYFNFSYSINRSRKITKFHNSRLSREELSKRMQKSNSTSIVCSVKLRWFHLVLWTDEAASLTFKFPREWRVITHFFCVAFNFQSLAFKTLPDQLIYLYFPFVLLFLCTTDRQNCFYHSYLNHNFLWLSIYSKFSSHIGL